MFDRFTSAASRVVVVAQEEARALNHNYIGTEHLLLGLLHEGAGTAHEAMAGFVRLDDARGEIVEIVGPGSQAPSGHIPFTPRAKKVLELSLREALALGHNYVGTEHLLLGIIKEGEGVAVQAMIRLGVALEAVRDGVLARLGVDWRRKRQSGPVIVNRDVIDTLLAQSQRLYADASMIVETLSRLKKDE